MINICGATELPSNEIDDDNDGYVECQIVESGWVGIEGVLGGDDCDDDNALTSPRYGTDL